MAHTSPNFFTGSGGRFTELDELIARGLGEAPKPPETGVEMYEHSLGKLVLRGEIDAETALHALDGYDASFTPHIDETIES